MSELEQNEDRIRWNRKWEKGDHESAKGSSMSQLLLPYLPTHRPQDYRPTLLDVGGGGSQDSLIFLKNGLQVTVVDVSDVGLNIACKRADEAGFGKFIHTVLADLEAQPNSRDVEFSASPALPRGPFDFVVNANYLNRKSFEAYFASLKEGGIFACVVATTTNLERNAHPSRRFLVKPGELKSLLPGKF